MTRIPDIGVVRGTFTLRDSTRQPNPPILHRKELLLPLDDPRREEFAWLTQVLEADGLFQDTRRIGYRRQWEALLAEKGWSIATIYSAQVWRNRHE